MHRHKTSFLSQVDGFIHKDKVMMVFLWSNTLHLVMMIIWIVPGTRNYPNAFPEMSHESSWLPLLNLAS